MLFRSLSYGIGSKKPIKLKKVINEYENSINKKFNINWGGKSYRNREVLVPWKKYKMLPGWKPKISIKNGLKIAYYKKDNK